jgi:hypothetical protein
MRKRAKGRMPSEKGEGEEKRLVAEHEGVSDTETRIRIRTKHRKRARTRQRLRIGKRCEARTDTISKGRAKT